MNRVYILHSICIFSSSCLNKKYAGALNLNRDRKREKRKKCTRLKNGVDCRQRNCKYDTYTQAFKATSIMMLMIIILMCCIVN